jgi:hypothetical protein
MKDESRKKNQFKKCYRLKKSKEWEKKSYRKKIKGWWNRKKIIF